MSTQDNSLELLIENMCNAYQNELYDHAIEYLSRIISIKESTSANREDTNNYLWMKASAYYKVNQWNNAISDFSKCIENDYINSESCDQDSDPFLWIGLCHIFLEDFKSALSNFTKATNYFPEDAYIFFYKGFCQFHLEEYEEALKEITHYLSLKSEKYATPFYIRGLCRIEINEFQLALEDFSKAAEFYSLDEEVNKEQIDLMEMDYEDILSFKGVCKSQLGDFENAKSDFSAVLEINSNHEDFFNRALCNKKLKYFQESYKDISLAIENCSCELRKKEYIEFKNELKENIEKAAGINSNQLKENKKKKNKKKKINPSNKVNQEELKEARERLNELIGLDNIKNEIENIISFTLLQIQREKFGLKPEFISNNFIFLGSPGTGKTEVARLIGKILGSLGVLTKGHFIETDRAGLIASYLGQTANKTLSVCKKALGGVLFIDEAYSLASEIKEDYGNEAIATLLKFMEDNRGNISIIAAGYPNEMDKFLDSNSGLRSRFGTKLTFKNYSPEELFQILLLMISERERKIKDKSLKYIEELVLKISLNKSNSFGNARSMRNLIEIAIKNQSLRLIKNKLNTKNDFIDLIYEDFSLTDEQLLNL